MKSAFVVMSFVSALLTSGVAHSQNFTLGVNALNNCIDVQNGGGIGITVPINAGAWEVSITSSNANYNQGNPGADVFKVALFITTFNDRFGWSYVVQQGQPTIINVPANDLVTAFYPDDYCLDNVGGATLSFTRR